MVMCLSCCCLPTLLIVSSLSVCACCRICCKLCVFSLTSSLQRVLKLHCFESCYVDWAGRGSSNKQISRTERKFGITHRFWETPLRSFNFNSTRSQIKTKKSRAPGLWGPPLWDPELSEFMEFVTIKCVFKGYN